MTVSIRGLEPLTYCNQKTIALPLSYILSNLLQCATPVVSYLVRYKIQHTAHLSPCGILNVASGSCLPIVSTILCNARHPSTRIVGLHLLHISHRTKMVCMQRYELLLICLSPTGSEIYPFGPVPICRDYCHQR